MIPFLLHVLTCLPCGQLRRSDVSYITVISIMSAPNPGTYLSVSRKVISYWTLEFQQINLVSTQSLTATKLLAYKLHVEMSASYFRETIREIIDSYFLVCHTYLPVCSN